jgi:pyrroloquinoline quinone (PQQ) biosynthesis protein C
MTDFYDRLIAETARDREVFLARPLIRAALASEVGRDAYLAYLAQAWHHVRHTCPLLARARALCGPDEAGYRAALDEYIAEETGHDEWILADIAALGSNPDAVRASRPGPAVQAMIGYGYYAIDHVSPYALLGMVHVLEGVSASVASAAAARLRASTGAGDGGGFSYLESHGALDLDHVAFFRDLVNGLGDAKAEQAIVETAKVIYRLFGAMFDDLDAERQGARDAA